jgi:hypothetical protein
VPFKFILLSPAACIPGKDVPELAKEIFASLKLRLQQPITRMVITF